MWVLTLVRFGTDGSDESDGSNVSIVVTVDKGIAPLTAAPNRTGRFPFIRLLSVWSFVIDTLCATFCMSHVMAMSMQNTLVI